MEMNIESKMESIDAKFDRFVVVINNFIRKVIKETRNLKELIESRKTTQKRELNSKKNISKTETEELVRNYFYPEEVEGNFSLEQILLEVADFTE